MDMEYALARPPQRKILKEIWKKLRKKKNILRFHLTRWIPKVTNFHRNP